MNTPITGRSYFNYILTVVYWISNDIKHFPLHVTWDKILLNWGQQSSCFFAVIWEFLTWNPLTSALLLALCICAPVAYRAVAAQACPRAGRSVGSWGSCHEETLMPGCREASHTQPSLRLIPAAQLWMGDYMACTVSNAYRHSWRMRPHTQPHTHTACLHLNTVRKLVVLETKAQLKCSQTLYRRLLVTSANSLV